MGLNDKMIVAVVIRGKKWWDRLAGQTYSASRINVIYSNGETGFYVTPFTHGDAVKQYAFEELMAEDVLWEAEGEPSSSRDCRERGITVIEHSAYVTKKEAERWGEL